MNLDKKKIIQEFLNHFETELAGLMASAKAAKEASTHPEAKAENKYDTRATEASYLAAGQAVRVNEIQKVIGEYKNFLENPAPLFSKVQTGALLKLEFQGKASYSFFSHFGGGAQVSFDGMTITVVSPKSPLGEALLEAKPNDEIEVETKSGLKNYKILEIH